MNPHAHPRVSASTNAGYCGPVPGRIARWFGARPRDHRWRLARRARVVDNAYELRFECEVCGDRRSVCVIERTMWELGIELPEVAREAPKS